MNEIHQVQLPNGLWLVAEPIHEAQSLAMTLLVPAGSSTDPDAALEALLDPGRTWPLTDQERDDLDLYSEPVGIFGLLNRTSTSIGRRRLRDMVDHPCLSSERILARQATVRWLDEHGDVGWADFR